MVQDIERTEFCPRHLVDVLDEMPSDAQGEIPIEGNPAEIRKGRFEDISKDLQDHVGALFHCRRIEAIVANETAFLIGNPRDSFLAPAKDAFVDLQTNSAKFEKVRHRKKRSGVGVFSVSYRF